jgi:aspartokinase-like uncharacterized kinase
MRVTAVFKVGGSLLEPPDLPELPARLVRLVGELGGERPLLIAGGGPIVDLIRRWDSLYGIGEEAAHWLAVRALTLSSRLLGEITPALRHAEDEAACEAAWRRGKIPILDSFAFLREVDEARPDPLPRRWRITSDSIAARVACHHGAPRLVLVKSAAIPDGITVGEAAARGLVDGFLGIAAHGLAEVLAVNLRVDPPAVSLLRP